MEDNLTNQKTQKWLLEELGCVVDTASNGEKSIQMINEFEYDIIFMELQMPVMDGFNATRSIREKENNSTHIPVIALTANTMKGGRQKSIDSGMDDYLTKPINKNALLKTLYTWSNSDHNISHIKNNSI